MLWWRNILSAFVISFPWTEFNLIRKDSSLNLRLQPPADKIPPPSELFFSHQHHFTIKSGPGRVSAGLQRVGGVMGVEGWGLIPTWLFSLDFKSRTRYRIWSVCFAAQANANNILAYVHPHILYSTVVWCLTTVQTWHAFKGLVGTSMPFSTACPLVYRGVRDRIWRQICSTGVNP